MSFDFILLIQIKSFDTNVYCNNWDNQQYCNKQKVKTYNKKLKNIFKFYSLF